ncbi:hypothetical protein PoB_001531400 [Plakobranchus ocellatus]|uniref:Uncharacterized protein n=1 Tax=Plakobranchus ocellatus TaxID=259542 RepID=A0AAV3Z487_9GAST|nr:hypothetical protein PoB_001531400 [Plakobranchus ocellatus]
MDELVSCSLSVVSTWHTKSHPETTGNCSIGCDIPASCVRQWQHEATPVTDSVTHASFIRPALEFANQVLDLAINDAVAAASDGDDDDDKDDGGGAGAGAGGGGSDGSGDDDYEKKSSLKIQGT